MAKNKHRHSAVRRRRRSALLPCLILLILLLLGYRVAGEPFGGLLDIPWPESVRPAAVKLDSALGELLPSGEAFAGRIRGALPEDADSFCAGLQSGFSNLVEPWLNKLADAVSNFAPPPAATPEPTAPPAVRTDGTFEIHFLNVGQADAAIILCDGEALMIDGGNADDSSLVYAYLRKTLGLRHLDAVIATHPHEDHIGGLSGALNACTVGRLYSPVAKWDSKVFSNMVKYAAKQNLEITIPAPGDSFRVGQAQVTFLAPLKDYESANELSLVVRIVYGGTSFLFTGDAGWDSEHDLLGSGRALESTLLKVGHHGSRTSTSYVFLREVHPQFAIISVGKDNSYGHPAEETLSRLRDAQIPIFRTDQLGTIVVKSDGKELRFRVD